ncbi:hypothetical protein [Neobacillus niacini]|uniref:hypothetical protein n=1 Tax=Neobacillus niacini TaxID=86668 RepID=UPI000AE315C3|nr:hypothetical protein [Neobacillus niacini]
MEPLKEGKVGLAISNTMIEALINLLIAKEVITEDEMTEAIKIQSKMIGQVEQKRSE